MHLAELQRPARGAVEEVTVGHCELAGGRPIAGRQSRAVDAEPLIPRELDVGTDVRAQGPDAPLQHVGGERGIEQAVAGPDLLGIRDATLGLLAEGGLQSSASTSNSPPSAASRAASDP